MRKRPGPDGSQGRHGCVAQNVSTVEILKEVRRIIWIILVCLIVLAGSLVGGEQSTDSSVRGSSGIETRSRKVIPKRDPKRHKKSSRNLGRTKLRLVFEIAVD